MDGRRVALVTGAGSGIGRSIAMALASRGDTVYGAGRRADALEDAAAEAAPLVGAIVPLPTDLTRDVEIGALAARVSADGGRVDVLAHAAGAHSLGTLERMPVEVLDAQYATNLRAPYVLTRALLAPLRSAGGQVVFVNSSAARAPGAENGQYAATKAGLAALADSVRAQVNGDGIRVLSVFPGRTATAQQELVHEHEGRDYRPELLLQPHDVATMVMAALDLPRSAEVTEIALRPSAKP